MLHRLIRGRGPTVKLAIAPAVLVAGVLGMAGVAGAHGTDHCYHGNIDPPGGWYNDYIGHYTTANGNHYNVYDHYLYGNYEHREYNLCG